MSDLDSRLMEILENLEGGFSEETYSDYAAQIKTAFEEEGWIDLEIPIKQLKSGEEWGERFAEEWNRTVQGRQLDHKTLPQAITEVMRKVTSLI